MAITRARTSSVAQGPSTRKTVLGGNDVILPGSYDAIGDVVVGAGGATSISFSSIPSTYNHLQIRGIARTVSVSDWVTIRFNSDSGTNYSYHFLFGSGSATGAGGGASSSNTVTSLLAPIATSTFGAGVIDILDYANTSKFKTVRSLNGFDANGSGQINLTSAAWRSTNAITSIELSINTLQQYSQFSLYGIK